MIDSYNQRQHKALVSLSQPESIDSIDPVQSILTETTNLTKDILDIDTCWI